MAGFCNACGAPMGDGVIFCPSCGKPSSAEVVPATTAGPMFTGSNPPPSSGGAMKIVLIICGNHRTHPHLDDWELRLHRISGEEGSGRFHEPQQTLQRETRAVLVCERVGSRRCPWSSSAGGNASCYERL